MDRLEQGPCSLGTCGRCNKYKMLAFRYWRGDKSTLLCTQCGGAAAIYLHKQANE